LYFSIKKIKRKRIKQLLLVAQTLQKIVLMT